MRALLVMLGLVIVFLLGGYVDYAYDWPFGALLGSSYAAVPLPAGAGGMASQPYYSRAQGAQDPPRSETTAGRGADMQRCIDTMIQRREAEQEARTVCNKIITGIGG